MIAGMKNVLTVLAAAFALVACSPSDDCADRIAANKILPADGCCTDDGLCIRPSPTPAACDSFTAQDCGTVEHPSRFEGGAAWVECPPTVEGQNFTACPVEAIRDH